MQSSERLDPVVYVTQSTAVGMCMADSGASKSDMEEQGPPVPFSRSLRPNKQGGAIL